MFNCSSANVFDRRAPDQYLVSAYPHIPLCDQILFDQTAFTLKAVLDSECLCRRIIVQFSYQTL